MMEEKTNTESEQKFKDAVEKFNEENNRHIEIVGEYQGGHKPIELYEKSVVNDKTYENSWMQQPRTFEQGQDGNPFLKHKSVPGKFEEMASETKKAEYSANSKNEDSPAE